MSSNDSSLYSPLFPAQWKRKPLYELAAWLNGLAFKPADLEQSGVPVIKITEIKSGISAQTKYSSKQLDRRYLIQKGDMLFCWSGQPETSIDTFWWGGPPGWLNQHIFKVTPNAALVLPEFFYYLLKYIKPTFISIAANKQTTGLGHVTKADLQRIEVSFPSFQTQKEIVDTIKPLDDRITLLRETNATLEAIAQAIFKSWFVDFDPVRAKQEGRAPEGMTEATAALFPDSFEESALGLVPRGWSRVALCDAYEINPTRKLKKGELAPYLDMASVPTAGHCTESVVMREMGSGAKFQNGDTLLARITPCLENGKSAFVDFLADGATGWGSTEFVVLRPKPPLPDFHAYLLCRLSAFREFAVQSMSGTSGRQRIQNDVLSRYPIAVPTESIAQAFGGTVQPIQRKIADNHALAQTLATLRDTLLPRLISGQLRLPDAEVLRESCDAQGVS